MTPSAARRHIDDAVYDALGLTAGERDAVHAGVAELVQNRRRKAGSVSGATGGGAGARRAPFQVVPLVGGYAPGVNDENLKDVILDLEDEEFLEKIGR